MKILIYTFVFNLCLGGCSLLPVQFQVVSWAADGLSLITTQKSLSDHSLSFVTQKDCAIWRGIVEGNICRKYPIKTILVAEHTNKNLKWNNKDQKQPNIDNPYLEIL